MSCGKCLWRTIKNNAQLVAILVAIVIGLILGVIIQRYEPSEETLMWLGFPGEIFLRLFSVCIVPLIVFGVISGASSVDPKSNGKAGGIALVYSLVLNLSSSGLGLLLCYAIKPGNFLKRDAVSVKPETNLKTPDIFADLVRNLFTDNILRATMQKARTDYIKKVVPPLVNNLANGTLNATDGDDRNVIMKRTLVYANTTNLMGVLFFCMVFGMAIGRLGKQAVIIHDFAVAGTRVIILILQWFMWYCPVGVASLIIGAIAGQRQLGPVLMRLGMLLCTVSVGNLLQAFVFLPLAFFALTRKNPLRLMLNCCRLAAVAFATCSSVMVLPEYYRACRLQGYDERLTSMTIPLMTTISNCGSALFIGAASLFVTQYAGVTVDTPQMIIILVLGAMSVFALPATPSSSIVIVMVILETISTPSELAGILFAVDWFADRIRTTVNGIAKVVGAAIISELCEEELLRKLDEAKASPNGIDIKDIENPQTKELSHLLSQPEPIDV